MKCFQGLAEAFLAEGTDVIFGVLGNGNLHPVMELVDRGVRFVPARHEQAAVLMADGYSRATGNPGICTVTHGPGLTQAGPALTTARLARSPLVLLAGDTPRGVRLHGQNIDQQSLSLATAGTFQMARLPETLAEDVQLAFRHARLGGGPVVLNVPTDLQMEELRDGWTYVPSSATLAKTQRIRPDAERIASASTLLAQSEKPVILAGRGAVDAGARGSLLKLADLSEAVLATTLRAKGWFEGEEFDVGIAGGYSSDLALETLHQADCVVAFGASLGQFTTAHQTIFGAAKIIHVDTDLERIGDVTPVDEAIIGDAKLVADALIEALDGLPAPHKSLFRTSDLAERLASHEAFGGTRFVGGPDGADPREVSLVCNDLLPKNRVLVLGLGHFSGYPAIHISVSDPKDLILPWHLGSMAMGLPVGIGVAVARPTQPTVVIEGDGGLMMCLAELETAARCQIPLLVLVFDDGAYGGEFHIMRRQGLPTDLSLFDNPDFAAVARSLGLKAYDADDIGGLRSALSSAFPLRHPTLIRIKITREVAHEELFRVLAGWSGVKDQQVATERQHV